MHIMDDHSPYVAEIKFERILEIRSENGLYGIGAPNNWKDSSKYFGYISTSKDPLYSARLEYADDSKTHTVLFPPNVAFFINYTDKIIFAIPNSYRYI